jgi:hypothetical protein
MIIQCGSATGRRNARAVATEGMDMELDYDKIDDAVLALLYLGLHDGARA